MSVYGSLLGSSLEVSRSSLGNLTFSSDTRYDCVSKSYDIKSNSSYTLNSSDDINLNSTSGNLELNTSTGELRLISNNDTSNAIIIESKNSNGGINQLAGAGGITINAIDGYIDILSIGKDINIGLSALDTPAVDQTQNVNIECFDNLTATSGYMYFVSSYTLSFISESGDISFGTSSNSNPIIQFENGNLLINQSTSNLDYQLDVAVTDSSNNNNGYNGIVVNTLLSNVAADLTLQTSNTLGDRTQCVLSIGAFGDNNNHSTFETYMAYQSGNMIIRLDGDSYNPNSLDQYNGKDFKYSDIGRKIYWSSTNRNDTIVRLSSIITPVNDTSNISVTGTYNGETSRVYLLLIDSVGSVGTYSTFKWSYNGGNSYQQQLIPITSTSTNYSLDSNISVRFARTTGFTYNQQFTFQTKITAIVTNTTSILIPEPLQILQPFYSYINTSTPSDIVIKTNNHEKLRITGDGAIGIHQNMPQATLDLNSNYNKIINVNQAIKGYQINPSIGYLDAGGYVVVWNSNDITGSSSHFDVIAQRYAADGTRYGNNFQVNKINNNNQSFPSIAGQKKQNSNHYIICWASNDNNYKIYCQIYHNNIAISTTYDIIIKSSTNILSNARCAGLYNGNYIIVWNEYDSINSKYNIKGQIIRDSDGALTDTININPDLPYSRRYPYVIGLPSNDTYNPNGFVVGYMTAISNDVDPQYTISVRVFNSINSNYVATTPGEIQITQLLDQFSNISDGLVSLAEININNVNSTNGGFIITFYRSYEADNNLYSDSDIVEGLTSGATASIEYDPLLTKTQIKLINTSNRFLISEEIKISSTVVGVGIITEKIKSITFVSESTAIITLDTGSRNIEAYRFNSNLTSSSQALWVRQINTSPLYNDLDRFTGNASIFQYKRPMSYVSIDNEGNALITWTTDSIPSVYYQLLSIDTGSKIGTQQKLTTEYDGLKQRNQVATHLQNISGSDYGFVIVWDNQSLDLQDTGIYQQLIGYKHSLFNLEDGNSNFIFNHYNQCGIGTNDPQSSLHIKTKLSNGTNSNNNSNDPANPAIIKLQNTSQHIITKQDLQSIQFIDGSNNILNKIQSVNSLRYDDLYPQPLNLIGFYKFDDTEGTQVSDYSIQSANNSNISSYRNTNGVMNNFNIETCWVPGIINNSLLFNGVNNYVFIEEAASNNLNTVLEIYLKLSISMWINIPSGIVTGAKYDILSNGGNLNLAGTYLLNVSDISNNGNMVLTSNIITHQPGSPITKINNGLLGNTKLNDSKWHHIVETVSISNNNCSISMYVDGVLENSSLKAGAITAIGHDTIKTYFGTRNGAINFFRGNMDELRFYNSILTSNEIAQLYNYGNINLPPKASLFLSPNATATYNQAVVIDDDGKINNLSSRPLPYTILSGELTAYKDSVSITGINTNFINEVTIGDIIVLDYIASNLNYNNEYTVISIISNTSLTLDRNAYSGIGDNKTYQSVIRRPSIYTFFDNSDAIRGHIDNYGNMMIGANKPSTMLEISGNTGNNSLIPEFTITNITNENTLYGRKTAINFRGYDAIGNVPIPLNQFVNLSRIETSHYETSVDNKTSMRFFINNGTEVGTAALTNSLMTLTSTGIGFGNENSPLTLMHATTNAITDECSFLLQSSYKPNISSTIFDERSNIYFGGGSSLNDTISANIKERVLCAISGSKSTTVNEPFGRLDFATNNPYDSPKLKNRMSILHSGNVGINNENPTSYLSVDGSISLPIIKITSTSSPYTLNDTHHTIICDITSGNITIILPLSIINNNIAGRIYILKKIGGNNLYINPVGRKIDNINYNSSPYYSASTTIRLQSDGTDWWILG